MENLTEIRIELGISAQKIASHLVVNNMAIEKQIESGIKKGLEEISDQGMLIEMIAKATRDEVTSIARSAILTHEIRNKMREMLDKKIMDKMSVWADGIASRMVSAMEDSKSSKA